MITWLDKRITGSKRSSALGEQAFTGAAPATRMAISSSLGAMASC